MARFTKDEVRTAVRDRYSAVARNQGSDCGCSTSCCSASSHADQKSVAMGYTAADVSSAPDGANLGLGCGNPQAVASLKQGETVLDLGSGGGFDCFLAARAVGNSGRVIGVDMPVADSSVDVIISNCVINLSPDKPQVFKEAFRVLKSGGRLAVSDVVASAEVPESFRDDLASVSACVGGASSVEELHAMLVKAGFQDIRIEPKEESRSFIKDWSPDQGLENLVLSATIEAVRP
jgi:arsenite methyltransferase